MNNPRDFIFFCDVSQDLSRMRLYHSPYDRRKFTERDGVVGVLYLLPGQQELLLPYKRGTLKSRVSGPKGES